MPRTEFEAAAWVPMPQTPEAHLAALAAVEEWVREQEHRTGVRSVLLTDTFGISEDGILGTYQRGRTYFSVRSCGRPTRGQVLVFRPSRKALEAAQRMALATICVWEGGPPVRGWAAQVQALDLSTGQITASHPALATHLRALVRAGNNGYANQFGRRDARWVLTEMRDQGLLGEDIPSALAAHGIHADDQEIIATLVKSIGPKRAEISVDPRTL